MTTIIQTLAFETIMPLIERINLKKEQLDSFRPLPTYALRSLQKSLRTEFSHHSTAIEGNTLTLSETRLVLEDGLTVKGKLLKEHFEVHNHEEALAYVESLAKKNAAFHAEFASFPLCERLISYSGATNQPHHTQEDGHDQLKNHLHTHG